MAFCNLTPFIRMIPVDSSLGPVTTLRTGWVIFAKVLLLLFNCDVYNNRFSQVLLPTIYFRFSSDLSVIYSITNSKPFPELIQHIFRVSCNFCQWCHLLNLLSFQSFLSLLSSRRRFQTCIRVVKPTAIADGPHIWDALTLVLRAPVADVCL